MDDLMLVDASAAIRERAVALPDGFLPVVAGKPRTSPLWRECEGQYRDRAAGSIASYIGENSDPHPLAGTAHSA